MKYDLNLNDFSKKEKIYIITRPGSPHRFQREFLLFFFFFHVFTFSWTRKRNRIVNWNVCKYCNRALQYLERLLENEINIFQGKE